jgi:hypothetical protein
MTEREGEGEEGDISESTEEALENYRGEIREKYDEDEGKEDGSSKRSKGEAEESRKGDDSDGNDSAETSSGGGRDGGTSNGRTEGTHQIDSHDDQEDRSENSVENATQGDARPENERRPDSAGGEDGLESMREHLKEKYPSDEKDGAEEGGTRPTVTPDEMDETDASEGERVESGEEKAAQTKLQTATPKMETTADDRAAPSETDGAGAKEDVGWEAPSESQAATSHSNSSDSPSATIQETGKQTETSDSQVLNGSQQSDRIEYVGTNRKDLKPPADEQGKSQAQLEVNSGGNYLPEHGKSTPVKDSPPNDRKDGSREGDEGKDERPMVRKASTYMDSLALIIPDRAIPKHEDGDDVFEVRISRVSKPEEEYKMYMTHNPKNERAYLPIRHVGAKKGEEFNVKRPEKYEGGDFARDYNASKPKGLENTSLEFRDGKFMLKVDGTEFALKEAKLRAHEGKVVLDGKLNDEDKNAMKIAKGIDGFDVRLKSDHAVVTSMKESKEGLTISYERTHHDEFPHVRLVKVENPERVDREKLESWEHKAKLDPEEMRLEKLIGPLTDSINMEFSEANARKAWEYWSSATSQSERFYQRGHRGGSCENRVGEIRLQDVPKRNLRTRQCAFLHS